MTNRNLLIELGTEELPPKNLKNMMQSFRASFIAQLEEAQLTYKHIEAFATPRRLALLVTELSDQQPTQETERRGPSVQAGLDADGNPTKALQGFMRSCGIEQVDQLTQIETNKGPWFAFQQTKPGDKLIDLVEPMLEKSLQALPIERRMRWGANRAEFVRPVHWLVVLYGNEVVPCRALGIGSGRISMGHRFMSTGELEIKEADSYLDQLMEARVHCRFDERRQLIEKQIAEIAANENASVEMDDALLDEVTALVEWPVALVGGFPAEFLEVPEEALISAMKEHQRYFPMNDASGKMMPRFITISNIESKNPAVVVEGNERVILPRLTDARFFYDQDRKGSLESLFDRLAQVVFQSELGSYLDKTHRIEALAGVVAERVGADKKVSMRAAALCKSDLVTDMVNEFPDLQGIMGGYYAEHDGEGTEVASAIREHYQPTSSGGDLPNSLEAKVVAIADKLDTLTGMFGIGQPPSGSKDPFALRRQTIGIIRMCVEAELNVDLHDLINESIKIHGKDFDPEPIHQYLGERLKSWYQDRGIRFDSVEAVVNRPLWSANLSDTNNSVKAIEAFRDGDQAEALVAANKRVANILKKSSISDNLVVDPARFEESEERSLFDALTAKEAQLANLESDQERLQSLGELRQDIDRYFDQVMVMADDEAIKNNRIATLQQMRRLFMTVADLSLLQQ